MAVALPLVLGVTVIVVEDDALPEAESVTENDPLPLVEGVIVNVCDAVTVTLAVVVALSLAETELVIE